MIGAIIGDIAGSRFEWNNHRSKDFELLTPKCFVTDDSIMALASAEALMRAKPDFSDLSAQACLLYTSPASARANAPLGANAGPHSTVTGESVSAARTSTA